MTMAKIISKIKPTYTQPVKCRNAWGGDVLPPYTIFKQIDDSADHQKFYEKHTCPESPYIMSTLFVCDNDSSDNKKERFLIVCYMLQIANRR